MKTRTMTITFLIIIALMIVIPLLMINGDFGGADGAGEQMIAELQPSYQPWFESFLSLPAETESMMFALQAALGAGFIGYVLGKFKGSATSSRSDD
ncbi:cobalt transporter [Paenibacillus sp. Soil766]|uniref:energy-coupling factor ABC transporter substrate-binding protein n=1 Tax=Paenibacillus sp. Soil766 TaxID=1736404 RepID=UPI00070E0FCF|nr:energy-coupling factor ABC transporter substrate-binding protein [Paenibacillus sp. Soil766]KRF03344.1 cobalt transporter [Paenibacillus sp. Soil766]